MHNNLKMIWPILFTGMEANNSEWKLRQMPQFPRLEGWQKKDRWEVWRAVCGHWQECGFSCVHYRGEICICGRHRHYTLTHGGLSTMSSPGHSLAAVLSNRGVVSASNHPGLAPLLPTDWHHCSSYQPHIHNRPEQSIQNNRLAVGVKTNLCFCCVIVEQLRGDFLCYSKCVIICLREGRLQNTVDYCTTLPRCAMLVFRGVNRLRSALNTEEKWSEWFLCYWELLCRHRKAHAIQITTIVHLLHLLYFICGV